MGRVLQDGSGIWMPEIAANIRTKHIEVEFFLGRWASTQMGNTEVMNLQKYKYNFMKSFKEGFEVAFWQISSATATNK